MRFFGKVFDGIIDAAVFGYEQVDNVKDMIEDRRKEKYYSMTLEQLVREYIEAKSKKNYVKTEDILDVVLKQYGLDATKKIAKL